MKSDATLIAGVSLLKRLRPDFGSVILDMARTSLVTLVATVFLVCTGHLVVALSQRYCAEFNTGSNAKPSKSSIITYEFVTGTIFVLASLHRRGA